MPLITIRIETNFVPQTFYITLDLTTPDVAPKTYTKRSGGKGPARAKWLNPGLRRVRRPHAADRSEGKASTMPGSKKNTRRAATEAQPEAGIDDDAPASPESTASQEGEDEPSADVNGEALKVQILGLHTRNPIVSYRGHVYYCQWTSNIGTELLFTQHEEGSELPVLRNLPGGVDLLAASSAKLVSNYVQLEPRLEGQRGMKDNNKKDFTLSIPTGHKASEGRKEQARFLERLMEIKEAKGEVDEVTVYATKRLSRAGWKQYLEDKNREERKKLQKTIDKGKQQKKIDEAKARLKELDKEDEKLRQAEKNWLMESRVQGKGRMRILGGDDSEPPRKRVRVDGNNEETPIEVGSTPTPQILDMKGNEGFLEEAGLEEDLGDYDEDMEGENFYDGEDYGDEGSPRGDEDIPGEDEDAPREDEDT